MTKVATVVAVCTPALFVACINFMANRDERQHARIHMLSAKVDVLNAQLMSVRTHPPKPPVVDDPRFEVCFRRTEALRSAILALVRLGAVSMVEDPGGVWADWLKTTEDYGRP